MLYDTFKLLTDYSARKILLKRVWPASWEVGLLFTPFWLCKYSWAEARSLSEEKLPQQVGEMPGELSGIRSKHQPRKGKEKSFLEH